MLFVQYEETGGFVLLFKVLKNETTFLNVSL